MQLPARRVRFRGQGEYRDEAERLLEAAGDTAEVFRGRLRSLLLKCPDGCGLTIVVNLDPRADKAWRIDTRKNECTLYPSVWLNDGCKSHFVVWRDHIVWCERFATGNSEPEYDSALEDRVLDVLVAQTYRTSLEIALELDELVWDIARVLRRLVARGSVKEGRGPLRDHFCKL